MSARERIIRSAARHDGPGDRPNRVSDQQRAASKRVLLHNAAQVRAPEPLIPAWQTALANNRQRRVATRLCDLLPHPGR